jgi:membrane protein required for colicin V production
MSIIDILLVIPPVLMAVYGFKAGFSKSFLSLTVFIIALIVLIFIFKDKLAGLASQSNMEFAHKNYIILFVVLFLAIALISFLWRKVGNLFRKVNLGPLNKVLGGAFGVVQGVIICLLVVFLLSNSPISSPGWFSKMKENSALLPKCHAANSKIIGTFS